MSTVVTERGPRPADEARGVRTDVLLGAAGLVLVVAAGVVPFLLRADPRAELRFTVAPLLANFVPHVGWGTPFAVAIAAAAVRWGPAVARRLPWRPLLVLTYGATLAWGFSLAMVDGWERGFAGNLASDDEYLAQVPEVGGIHPLLRGFASHIPDYQPGRWTTHVAAHPPGAFLVYIGLDRIGLGGGAWASTVTLAIGASAGAAVMVAVRVLGGQVGSWDGEQLARRAAPFLVLAPTAIWVAVSADGMFAAVAAWGIALLALAATRATARPWVPGVGAGLLLGYGSYLSYGLVLMALPAVAVLVAARNWRPLVPAVLAALAVVGVFTALGFWWLDGYHLVVYRYYQGIAARRTYSYWLWGNVAALLCSVGLAVVPAVRRALRPARLRAREGLTLLVVGALAAIAYADYSGLSRSETERIWLPFGVWLIAAAALLPARHHARWLTVSAVSALLLNHLLLTAW